MRFGRALTIATVVTYSLQAAPPSFADDLGAIIDGWDSTKQTTNPTSSDRIYIRQGGVNKWLVGDFYRQLGNLLGVLPVVHGGTAQTAFTDGQLLIGNTATGGLNKASLTAGANITITPGNGSITIASSGGTTTPGGTNGQIQWTNAGAFDGMSAGTGLFIDTTNKQLKLTSVATDQSAGAYTFLAGDAAKTALVGAFTYTMPQAGTTGFGSGYSVCALNTTSGTATLNTTTSVFKGAGGGSTLSIRKNDAACPSSDGTNYATTYLFSGLGLTQNGLLIGGGNTAAPSALASLGTTTTLLHGNSSGAPSFGAVALGTDVSGILPAANGGAGAVNGLEKANGAGLVSQAAAGTDYLAPNSTIDCLVATCSNVSERLPVGWTPGVDLNGAPLYTALATTTVVGVRGRVETKIGAAATIGLYKAPNGTPCTVAFGAIAQTTANFDANGTNYTNQSLTLVGGAANILAAGDSLCLITTNSSNWTAGPGVGGLTVKLQVQ